MKNKDVKNKVKTAFESVTPDNSAQIRSQIDSAEQVAVPVTSSKKSKSTEFMKKLAVAVACVAVLIVGGFGIYGYSMNYTTVTEVSFDVNPSITMSVNANGRVRTVSANNTDAQRVLEGLNFEGSTYEVAANAIIGAMLRTGYLSELSNSVLVSVSDDKAQRSKEIENKIMAEIERIFTLENFNGAVICQSVTDNAQLQSLANEYGITMGKASLIDKIIKTSQTTTGTAQTTAYTFRDLAGLTINELNVLAESLSVNLGESASGTASTQGYIGEEQAKQQALAYAGIASGEITGNIRTEFDFENGVIVYEVTFRTADYEYEIKVNAADGQFAAFSEELKAYAGAVGETLTADGIRAAAAAKAGLDVTAIMNYRTEWDDGEYEVYFNDGTMQYKLEIRTDGVILSYEKEVMPVTSSGSENPSGEITPSREITAERAKEIAFAIAAERWSDFDPDNIRQYDDEHGIPEREDGVLAYEIEFKCGGYEYEFRIKASDGTVIKAERERDD